MLTNLIVPAYTAVLAVAVILVVPKKEIRYLGPYALILALIADMFNIMIFTKLLGVGGYKNFEPFGFMGIPLFASLAVTVYLVLYLYFMPKRKPWIYIFPLMASGFSTIFSNVLVKLGAFYWNYGKVIIPFIIFLNSHSFITWAYLRLTQSENEKMNNLARHKKYWFANAPARKIKHERIHVRKPYKIK